MHHVYKLLPQYTYRTIIYISRFTSAQRVTHNVQARAPRVEVGNATQAATPATHLTVPIMFASVSIHLCITLYVTLARSATNHTRSLGHTLSLTLSVAD